MNPRDAKHQPLARDQECKPLTDKQNWKVGRVWVRPAPGCDKNGRPHRGRWKPRNSRIDSRCSRFSIFRCDNGFRVHFYPRALSEPVHHVGTYETGDEAREAAECYRHWIALEAPWPKPT